MPDVVKGLKGYLYRVIEISDYKPADGSKLLIQYYLEGILGICVKMTPHFRNFDIIDRVLAFSPQKILKLLIYFKKRAAFFVHG